MCGIFGYYTFGTPRELQAILDVIFTGLKRLEYRGYDSAGLCVDSSEVPTRVSTDGSRRSSMDGGVGSPFASGNGTPGEAVEAALSNGEGGCPSGSEPVIIKCPGKIENLEKMTDAYVKDHVSALHCAAGCVLGLKERKLWAKLDVDLACCPPPAANRQPRLREKHGSHAVQQRAGREAAVCTHITTCFPALFFSYRAWTQPRCTATTWPSHTRAGPRTAPHPPRTRTRTRQTPAGTLWWCTTASSQTTRHSRTSW
jgi:hypothetical protein